MIHYQLRCDKGHEFDGWFKDSSTFERQAQTGLVECPTCGDVKIERALMAPAVSTRETTPPPPPRPPSQSVAVAAPPNPGQAPIPAQMIALLQRLRAEVEKNCDYVGATFADEARKMHRGESDRRGIYGEASPDEAAALADEGIDINEIPWVSRADG